MGPTAVLEGGPARIDSDRYQMRRRHRLRHPPQVPRLQWWGRRCRLPRPLAAIFSHLLSKRLRSPLRLGTHPDATLTPSGIYYRPWRRLNLRFPGRPATRKTCAACARRPSSAWSGKNPRVRSPGRSTEGPLPSTEVRRSRGAGLYAEFSNSRWALLPLSLQGCGHSGELRRRLTADRQPRSTADHHLLNPNHNRPRTRSRQPRG